MLILTIRTDNPQAEVGIFEDGKQVAYSAWEAHRELAKTIHSKIKDLLDQTNHGWADIQGFVVYKGPGSFTGLRIGSSVANALAYGLKKPVASTKDQNWIKEGIKILETGKGQLIVLPDYGAEANTTTQRK